KLTSAHSGNTARGHGDASISPLGRRLLIAGVPRSASAAGPFRSRYYGTLHGQTSRPHQDSQRAAGNQRPDLAAGPRPAATARLRGRQGDRGRPTTSQRAAPGPTSGTARPVVG